MKTTSKNNPVVVGALLGILVATLYFLMKQTGGGNTTAAVLTPVADIVADNAPKIAAVASQGDPRDPFDHPALHRVLKDGVTGQNPTAEAQDTQESARTSPDSKVSMPSAKDQTITGLPIPPDRTRASAAIPIKTASGASVPNSPHPIGSVPDASAQEAEEPLKGWRLTATIAGYPPRAVIERAGTGASRVGIGERIGDLKVTAIYEQEVVLSDAHHLYTLPLQNAPSTPEDSKDNKDSKDAGVETTTPTGRENENGTAKIHP